MLSTTVSLRGYDLYVSSSANPDSIDGSFDHPFQTIQAAIDSTFSDTYSANIGEAVTIWLLDASYTENIAMTYFQSNGYSIASVRDVTIKPHTPYVTTYLKAVDFGLPILSVNGHGFSVLRLHSLRFDNGPEANISTSESKGIYFESSHLHDLEVAQCEFDNLSISIDAENIGYLNSLVIEESVFYCRGNNFTHDGAIISTGGGDCGLARVANCSFTGYNTEMISTYALSLGSKFDEINLADNIVTGLSVGIGVNQYAEQIIQIGSNEFHDSLLRINTSGTWTIHGNKFVRESSTDDYSPVVLAGGSSTIANCIIDHNLFWGYGMAIKQHFLSSPLTKLHTALTSNSFLECDMIISMQRHPNMTIESNRIVLYRNNLYYGNLAIPFEFLDIDYNPLILLSDFRVPVSHSHFSTALIQDPSLIIHESVSSGPAYLALDPDSDTYSLTRDSSVKSPCINTGYRGENTELTDPDGTPPDIGCVYYPHHNQKYFSMLSSTGIEWLSFPVLDDRTYLDNEYWNELGHLFEAHMSGAPYNAQLNQIQWSYYGETQSMYYDPFHEDWQNSLERAIQPKGYKVKFNTGISIDPIVVNGFKADPDTTPATWTVSVAGQPFENWIGYYVPFTKKAGDALSRLLPGSIKDKYLDYVYSIKTRHWGTCRLFAQPGSPWIIDPDTYTLSEGETVALFLLPDAPSEMFWNAMPDPVPPYEKPPATAFSFEEKLDYTSVFIEFDPADLPDEVGLYVNGVCKGAAVVDSSLIDACFYNEVAKDGGELEIVFYYDGKGKKAAKGWTSYNPDSMVFENSGINVNNIGNYAYISFKSGEGDSPFPLVTNLQPNYPNPFNPSTNISFILAKDMNTRLDIYNLRGQRVKTLCKNQLTKGKHTYVWSGQDDQGHPVASGIYFSRLTTSDGSYVHKMMLMK